MSIEIEIGPLSAGEFRRLFRYAEAESSGERAPGKADDPLRTVAQIVAGHGGTAVGEEGFRLMLPDDADAEVIALRAALIREGLSHRLEQDLPGTGLTEEVTWNTHGDHDHERAVLRTHGGEIAMMVTTWAEMAVIASDDEIRERLNDYFFTDSSGHHMGEIPVDIDDEITDTDRSVDGMPLLLADEWAMVARFHGDLELRDRLNDLFAGRREIGGDEGDEGDDDSA